VWAWRLNTDGLEKVEEVTEGLNNMCVVVENIMSPWCGWPMVAPGIVGKILVTTLYLGQFRVVFSKRLKIFHGQQYRDDLCGRLCGHITAHR